MKENQKRQRCPAPRNFSPAGFVIKPKLELEEPQFIKPYKVRGVRAAGMRYEKKVQRYLLDTFPHHYIASPWFTFEKNDGAKRIWCQPDGLLIDIRAGLITIIEVKLRHTSDAWWQTRQLYLPVVRRLFGTSRWDYNILEIVRWYDPDTLFPERYKLCPEIGNLPVDKFGVHIWKPT